MSDLPKWALYWRISTNSTLGRRNFFAVGLPIPNTPIYKGFSTLVPQSQGGQARQGYINVTVMWNELTREQGFTLKRLVETVLAAGTPLYMSVDFNDGTYPPGSFYDVSGTPYPVVLEAVQNSQGLIYQNVELKLNNVTVIGASSGV